MNRIVRAVTLSVLINLPIAAREPGPGAGEPAGAPELTVRIYDYAELSSGYLTRAADKAQHVYRQVGIETRWIQCRVSLDVPEIHPDCEIEAGPTVLQMKILPEVMAARFGLSEGVFGFALPPREGGFGNVASIFHQRVGKLGQISGTPSEVILGYMLAHEAGHLLLGMNGHSSKGIMHVPWKVDDLQRAEVGGLKFTREQAERMRRQVTDRWKVEADTVPAALTVSKAPSLTLRIDDHAQLHPHILRLARKPARRIFRQFGIEIGWLDCPTSARQSPTNPACQVPLGQTDFVVRILPESMTKKYKLPKAVFGYTLPTTKGRVGRTVNIFSGRVFDMAYYGPVGGRFENAQGIILGHVIAHEVGHILLGPSSHSEKGIMSFPWGRKQLVDASRGGLQFTPEQARKIMSKLKWPDASRSTLDDQPVLCRQKCVHRHYRRVSYSNRDSSARIRKTPCSGWFSDSAQCNVTDWQLTKVAEYTSPPQPDLPFRSDRDGELERHLGRTIQ